MFDFFKRQEYHSSYGYGDSTEQFFSDKTYKEANRERWKRVRSEIWEDFGDAIIGIALFAMVLGVPSCMQQCTKIVLSDGEAPELTIQKQHDTAMLRESGPSESQPNVPKHKENRQNLVHVSLQR